MYTYDEVMDKINTARRFGKLPGAEVMQRVMEQLGLKNQTIPYIHVAGTNGKGSVCAFLSSILQEAGLSVGTFTSPHLVDFEERIQINGEMISKEESLRLGAFLLEEDFGVELTMFDYCLAMALLYFREQKVDVMVIETGLGGRLDSTNAIGIPQVCVITKIGFDHMAILGNTLEEIASEKAGIIKKGCSVVVEQQEKEASDTIQRRFRQINHGLDDTIAKLYMVTDEDIYYTKKIKLQLPGVHQWENAAAAMMAADIFLEKSKSQFSCLTRLSNRKEKKKILRTGLENTIWPGRMELISREPFFMVDGAHNGHGVEALCKSLKALYPGEKFVFFMAVMADKDYEQMVEQMLPIAKCFYTFTPDSSRALQNTKLAEYINRRGVKAFVCESYEDIFQGLDLNAKNVAFGSLYFIGDIKIHWRKQVKV